MRNKGPSDAPIRRRPSPFLASLAVLMAVAGVLGPGSPSQATGTTYMLDNGKIRFGGGGHNSTTFTPEASINDRGNLLQPFYKSPIDSKWYKLTYSNYPLDLAIGTGTGGANWTASTIRFDTDGASSALTGQTFDATGFTRTSGTGSPDVGYGTLVTSGTVTLGGAAFTLQNEYTLGQTASFVKITTTLTNASGGAVQNVNLWVGTRDDWVGTDDDTTKTRGTLSGGAFAAISNAADSAPALQIVAGSEGILFYSTTEGAGTSIDDCCDFSNSYDVDPSTSPITDTGDGSYALHLPAGTLANGASVELVWYYAAGPIADLTSVVAEVAQAAGVGAPPTPAVVSSPVADPEGGLPVVTPPGSSSGSVGGVPSAPTPSVPTSGTAQFEVGVVRTEIRTGGAGTVTRSAGAPVVEVVRDRVGTVGGGGMAPGGIVEVWMPLPGGGSRQVALLPVGEDGSFDGALPFTGELDGNGPLPIGERTIQLYGTDANGQLTVVNVGIRVEQPGPLAPEPERAPGAPPTLTPGQSLATNAGLPTPVTVTPLPGERTTRVQGDGWLLEIDVPEGTVRDEAGAPIMEVVAGDDTEVRGTGFLPGTRAYVWIMSDPTFLGEVRIGSDGTFAGDLPVDVAPGQHTLQVSGVGTDGYVRAANLGVIVLAGDGNPRPTRVDSGGGSAPLLPLRTGTLALALAAGLGAATLTRRRAPTA